VFQHDNAPAHMKPGTHETVKLLYQTLFHSMFDVQTAHTSTQLTVSCGLPFMNVFTIETSRALMNWNSAWFRSSAILTGSLSTRYWPTVWKTHNVRSCEGRSFQAHPVNSHDLFCVTGLLKYSVLYCKNL